MWYVCVYFEVMKYVDFIVDFVGDIFFVKFNCVMEGIVCMVFVKFEYLNFGGFFKDWIVVWIIDVVEVVGDFELGGIIVELMSGNIGVGFVLVV